MMAQQWKWQWPHSLHFIISFHVSFKLSGLICIYWRCSHNPWRAFNRKWCLKGQSVWCVQKICILCSLLHYLPTRPEEQLYHHRPKGREKNCFVCDVTVTWHGYSNLMAVFAFWPGRVNFTLTLFLFLFTFSPWKLSVCVKYILLVHSHRGQKGGLCVWHGKRIQNHKRLHHLHSIWLLGHFLSFRVKANAVWTILNDFVLYVSF